MSSLPNLDPSRVRQRESDANAPSPDVQEHGTASDPRSTPDRSPVLSATRFTSHQLSECTDATIPGAFLGGGALDDASSATLQDTFPWHAVGVEKFALKMPATIAPALLLSPSSLDDAEDGSCEADRESNDSGAEASRYTILQNGKGKVRSDGGCDGIAFSDDAVGPPSPGFQFDGVHNSVEDWVMHSRPILHDYADRQTSLPLGRRLEVSVDEPPKFILGAIQLLANRDKKDCTDGSRRLGPQLIENFVDLDYWTKDYLRYHHGMQDLDTDIPALLTIVMNNFYEGLVQLIDRLVEFALEHMHFCGRSSLNIEDFSFGFDFKMSQDLPFYVETSSRIREPLPIPAVKVRPTAEPVTTSYGRQVKPTERAQAASKQAELNAVGKQNKEKISSEINDKETVRPIAPLPNRKKKSGQPSSQSTEAPAISQAKPSAGPSSPSRTSAHTKFRPVRPSNLGSQPPILASSSSTAGATPVRNSKSDPSASVSVVTPKTSDSAGSTLTAIALPRLTITIPAPSLPSATASATNRPEGRSSEARGTSQAQTNPADASETTLRRGTLRSRTPGWPRGPRQRGRGRGLARGGASTTPNTRTGDVSTQPTACPLEAGDAGSSTTVNPPVASPALGAEAENAAAVPTPRARSHSTDRSSGDRWTRAFQPSPQRLRTGKLVHAPDPGHPLSKKRKLDDCEE